MDINHLSPWMSDFAPGGEIPRPLALVTQIEHLLAERHHGPVDAWDRLSAELGVLESELLALPLGDLVTATNSLLSVLHRVVEAEGLGVD